MTGPKRSGSASVQLIGGPEDGALLHLYATPRMIYVPKASSTSERWIPESDIPDTVPDLLGLVEYRLLFLDEDRHVAFYVANE